MNLRATAIIIKDGKILLLHRIKEGREYFVFPGGGVEDGETAEEATQREIKEEVCLDAEIDKFLFQIFNQGREEKYFLITKFEGEVKLGGPEAERMNENDQYYPIWVDILEIGKMETLYPKEGKEKVMALLK